MWPRGVGVQLDLLLDSDDETGSVGDPATSRHQHHDNTYLQRGDTLSLATQNKGTLYYLVNPSVQHCVTYKC